MGEQLLGGKGKTQARPVTLATLAREIRLGLSEGCGKKCGKRKFCDGIRKLTLGEVSGFLCSHNDGSVPLQPASAEEASAWAGLVHLLPLPVWPRVLKASTVFQSLGMTRGGRNQNSRWTLVQPL